MLDIVLFREDQGGDPGKVRESQRRRYKDVGAVDAVIDRDTKWRAGTRGSVILTLLPLLIVGGFSHPWDNLSVLRPPVLRKFSVYTIVFAQCEEMSRQWGRGW